MTEIISRKEANLKGLRYYYTGKPCKRGHLANRLVSTCSCVECQKICGLAWNKNPENIAKEKERHKIRNVTKREEINEKQRMWRSKNPDKVKNYYYKDIEKNRKVRRENSARYRIESPERDAAARKKWRLANPETVRAMNQNKRAKRLKAEGRHTRLDLLKILKNQKEKCYYCFCSISEKYQIEHKVPISKGGSNWPSNIVLSCEACNREKKTMTDIEFARKLGRLL